MKSQIVSHAGLLVSGSGIRLVTDPWVIGNSYWRSWWNYSPVKRDLTESLRPDSIYLTRIHWNRFRELESVNDEDHQTQIHTTAYVMRQCMGVDLFSHLSIGKQVCDRVISKIKKYVVLLNSLFNFCEYGMFPPRRMLNKRFLGTWRRRWREVLFSMRITFSRVVLRREFDMARYLPAAQPADDFGAGHTTASLGASPNGRGTRRHAEPQTSASSPDRQS